MALAENNNKELIIQQLKDAGCRITKQRLVILDIILNSDPSCCKEIYAEASKIDKSIGSATVYRMVNTLEEIGVINRKNMYQVDCTNCTSSCIEEGCSPDGNCDSGCTSCQTNIVVTLEDGEHIVLNRDELSQVLEAGLKSLDKIDNNKTIKKVVM